MLQQWMRHGVVENNIPVAGTVTRGRTDEVIVRQADIWMEYISSADTVSCRALPLLASADRGVPVAGREKHRPKHASSINTLEQNKDKDKEISALIIICEVQLTQQIAHFRGPGKEEAVR